ncbi:hypothetical protein MNBD_GAMMA08-115 [hydrothermal vent metagenome]|uniref:Uncharacterized protein n=1 Tax=hydrothermal vent metagenome TaxID=652676 RepID=A0A3B0XNZ5_9ZZZZ
MKKTGIFIILLILATALWYGSIVFLSGKSSIGNIAITSDNIFTLSHSLLLILFLTAVSYALVLLTLNVKFNQLAFEKNVQSSNMHLEIIALSSLIDECDTTLHRYDRWEEAGIKGDYMNAKTSVRDKMNLYRENLEKKYDDIQQLAFDKS